MTRAVLIATCVLYAAACSGEARPPSEPAPAEPAAAQPAAEPAQPAAEPAKAAELEPNADELPVREDFEAEAEQQVTLANYRSELDKLEQEIAARD